MKISITLTVFLFFISNIITAQGADEIVKQSLYNPSDFKILNNQNLIVSDNTTDYPIYLIDIKADKILARIKRGNGPGELSAMYKNISLTSNNIYVWDYGRQILNYYDYDLKYKGSRSLNDIGYIYNVKIETDKVLVLDSSEEFIKIFEYDSDIILGPKLKSYSISDHKNFKQFEHSALRQAFKIHEEEGTFYLANEFTSLVISLNYKGIKFTTLKPLNTVQENRQGVYVATDLLYNKLCSLDIAKSPEYLIVLSKGEKASMSDISEKYNNRIDEYLEDFINTNQILLYDIEGNFLKTINLEKPVKKIEIYHNKLFYLRTLRGEPSIGYHDLSTLLGLSETG